MAGKDIAEKALEAYNDVFADIINGLLFHGKHIVMESELAEGSSRSVYKADGKIRMMERDIHKYWEKGRMHIAVYGIENQTEIDPDMPLRLFGYDGAAYRAQLLANSGREEGQKIRRCPVITLVLYFGYKRRWKKPLTLYDRLEIPEELHPFVNDYRMNLYEIAYLSDEQVAVFRSDFGIVADYFVQMRKNGDYTAPRTKIQHVHELLQLMSVMTQDDRFCEVYSPEMEGRDTSMCEVLDKIENMGIEQGFSKGTEDAFSLVKLLMDNNRMDDLKQITEDIDYRNKLLKELLTNNTK